MRVTSAFSFIALGAIASASAYPDTDGYTWSSLKVRSEQPLQFSKRDLAHLVAREILKVRGEAKPKGKNPFASLFQSETVINQGGSGSSVDVSSSNGKGSVTVNGKKVKTGGKGMGSIDVQQSGSPFGSEVIVNGKKVNARSAEPEPFAEADPEAEADAEAGAEADFDWEEFELYERDDGFDWDE